MAWVGSPVIYGHWLVATLRNAFRNRAHFNAHFETEEEPSNYLTADSLGV